jgi:hypothetical protein
MRAHLILLAPLLLSGCIDGSASYSIDGSDHALIMRAQQEHFWSKQVTLRLIAARLPDCQRQLVLGTLPADDLQVDLFADGDNVYTLRAGDQQWTVETRNCTELETPAQAPAGTALGSFHLDEGKTLVFEQAAPAPAAAPDPAQAAAAAE